MHQFIWISENIIFNTVGVEYFTGEITICNKTVQEAQLVLG